MSNEYFDNKAATWDDNPVRANLSGSIASFVSQTIPLSSQFSILDYGCGTGLVSFLLSSKVKSVCAADISEGMLEQIRKKIKSQNVSNIEVLNFDITKDKPINKTFDFVVSAMAMHHIDDPYDTLTKLAKLLKPGGWMAIADLCSEDGSFHEQDLKVHKGFDPENFAQHLKKLNMTSVTYKNVFEIPRNDRIYPVFCVCAKKL